MKKTVSTYSIAALCAGILIAIIMPLSIAHAHCDTLAGPVVIDAQKALDKGDITPVLKWIRSEDEKELRELFMKTLAVRETGTEARDLADMYFFETLVRIHRAGEGAPYTGLKSAEAIDPAVVEADRALESGSAEILINKLTAAISSGIESRFIHALEAQKHEGESVKAGREFVHAYVEFTHYVEGLHQIAAGSDIHHEVHEKKEHEHSSP